MQELTKSFLFLLQDPVGFPTMIIRRKHVLFETINIKVKGLHEYENKKEALDQAKGYFTGGGNTFLLVKTLHEEGLMSVVRKM